MLVFVSFAAAASAQSTVQPPGVDFESVRAAADAARTGGDRSKALELYSQAVQINPAWPDGWWFLGTLQYGEDQYGAARDSLTHFITLAPPAGPATALRGLCEFEMGDFARSLDDMEAGIAHGALNQPRNAKILLYHEALALNSLSRFEEALGKEKSLAQESGENPELAVMIGLSGLRRTTLPKDVHDADRELLGTAGHAAFALMTGDNESANAAFQDLFARYPQQPDLHYLRGYLLLITDPDGAVAEFKQELRVNPGSAVAQAMAAWSLGMQSHYADALPFASKAVTEDPSMTLAQLVYGRALVETGDASGGLPHLEKVLGAEPGNLEAHMALAKALTRLGRTEEARQERLVCLSISEKEVSPRATQ